MAKKGGTSEINGFVSVKGEDIRKIKQKVPSKHLPGARINKSVSEAKKDESEENLKRKKLISKNPQETKKASENDGTKISKSTVSVHAKVKLNVQADGSKAKSTTSLSKDKILKDQGIKTSDKKPIVRTSTEHNVSNTKKVLSRDVAKTKRPSITSQKGEVPATNKNAIDNRKGISKDKIKTVSNENQNKEKKTKLESSKTETIKKVSAVKKIIETNKSHDKNIKTSKIKDINISNVSSKSVPSLSSKEKRSKSEKSVTSDKEKNLSEDKVLKKELLMGVSEHSGSMVQEKNKNGNEEKKQEDPSVKSSSYKDLIYFEVDMGNSKQPSSSRVKSARIKSAVSQRPPLSRQGTFTKDESPSESLENSVQVTREEKTEIEGKPVLATDDYDIEYEDDFEDYESDFEEYISESDTESGLSLKSESDTEPTNVKTFKSQEPSKSSLKLNVKMIEEERKLDSGNYDLSSKPVLPYSVKQKQLEQIKEAISQENTSLFENRMKNTSEETAKKEDKTVVFDFISALQKQQVTEKEEKEKQRSTIILQMINLHQQNIDLFEDTFSDVDLFQDIYLNRNVSHAFTETELIWKEEETQTNKILSTSKWTQYPISYHPCSSTSFSLKVFLEDQRGYGGDNIITDTNQWYKNTYNTKKLYNFINSASKIMLIMLEEEARWKLDEHTVSIGNSKDDLSISDGCIPIQVDNLCFLKDRPICDILFSPCDPNIFVSSHRFVQDIEKLQSFTDQFFGRSILCVWSILEPSQPLYLLVASCQICAVTFDLAYDNLIYAGLTDGSVCLWDLNEPSMYHKETIAGSMEYLLRTPTFCSSHLVEDDGHHNVIVSIKSLGYESDGELPSKKFNPSQVITLDADGIVVLWFVNYTLSSLERSEDNIDKFNSGMSFWGKFKLVMGRTLNPENILPFSDTKWGLQFLCMSLAPEYDNKRGTMKSILAGTNIGSIVQFYISEDEINVPVFSNECGEKNAPSVMCIERNPHGFPVFLAGCNDGRIRFYVLDKPKPFKVIFSDEDFVFTPISKIRWSPIGIGLFFALDKNFCLHVWDIGKGDRSPQTSVSLKALQAAYFDVTFDKKSVYIGLTVKRFQIEIHRLKEQFITKDFEQEKIFFEKCIKLSSNLISKH